MGEPLVVEVVRSGLVESVHLADCAVVDEGGRPVAYLRSAAKPLQAAVCLAEGWSPDDERRVALACGSHSGEPEHLRLVSEILAAAGLGEDALRCPPARPIDPGAAPPSRIAHNCSGKHAAMLACSRVLAHCLLELYIVCYHRRP